jgi:hypothetical protein
MDPLSFLSDPPLINRISIEYREATISCARVAAGVSLQSP